MKPNKQYLRIIVSRHDGTVFTNPLKLSEVHFISKLALENESLTIILVNATDKEYEQIFG